MNKETEILMRLKRRDYFERGVTIARGPNAKASDMSRFSPAKPNGLEVEAELVEAYEYGFEWGWVWK